MGLRGPNRLSKETLSLRGSPLANRPDETVPTEAAAEIPRIPCPQHLGKHGRKLWRETEPELRKRGVLSKVALTTLCVTWDDFLLAKAVVDSYHGKLDYVLPNGIKTTEPCVKRKTDAWARVVKAANVFGIEAPHIAATKQPESESEAEERAKLSRKERFFGKKFGT